jgi:hypothetical protein
MPLIKLLRRQRQEDLDLQAKLGKLSLPYLRNKIEAKSLVTWLM